MLPIKICCLSSDATDGELEGTALRNLSPPSCQRAEKIQFAQLARVDGLLLSAMARTLPLSASDHLGAMQNG